MRVELGAYEGKEVTVIGTFKKYGRKWVDGKSTGWTTVLLIDLTFEDGTECTGHLWFLAKKGFLTTTLRAGARVKITGVVSLYTRENDTRDYCIADYTKILVLEEGNQLMPLKKWKHRMYYYWKFVLGGQTRWYKAFRGEVKRLEYWQDGFGAFHEKFIDMDKDDNQALKYIYKDLGIHHPPGRK